jgi:hypothetical protein
MALLSECEQVRPGKASASGPPSVFDGLHVEELQLCSEVPPPGSGAASTNGSNSSSSSASQAWVPVRVVKAPQPHATPLPAVVLLHATGLGKDSLAARQAQFARRGYLAVAMDCRYHGDRAQGGDGCRDAYQEALVRAWRGSGERPFLLDNVWDLLRLLDWLGQRWGRSQPPAQRAVWGGGDPRGHGGQVSTDCVQGRRRNVVRGTEAAHSGQPPALSLPQATWRTRLLREH